MHNYNSELSITESIFNENTANFGGAIYNDKSLLTIVQTELAKNIAYNNGGAIKLENSEYEPNNCIFKDNEPDDVNEGN